jgi:hypothetical protein
VSRTRIEFGMLPTGMPIEDAEPNLEAVRQRLHAQMRIAAQFVKGLWVRRAMDLHISRSGAYVRGIAEQGEIRVVAESSGATHIEVTYEIVNTAPHARIVEDGHPAFSLPQAINWGSTKGRIKHGAKGPYLHIPFRHAAYQTPAQRASKGTTRGALRSMMPEHIYKTAKQLSHTMKRKEGPIHKEGRFVQADRYQWGGRMRHQTSPKIQLGHGRGQANEGFEAHRGERQVGRDRSGKPLVNPAWKSSKFKGMFRTGPPGHTRYMTIRTITPRSRGWNIPAQVGYGVARQVAANVRSGAASRRLRSLLENAATGGAATG